ncbi:hypothetical protein K445DRAFT_315156 [Daldinia sp. EC12]|nr:hypothetical protein K445DRAFT_315156 [Daldinia sp. EC12]
MPRYTRDRYVTVIKDFYTFLTRLHIPKSAIVHPPEGGWPNITPEYCSGFGKSAFVIDLLKHLPYIEGGRESGVDIHYKCNVLDYSTVMPVDFGNPQLKVAKIPAEADGPIPPHTVVIAEGHESGGRVLMLDTEEGVIIEEEIRCQCNGDFDVMEYFADLKKKYETLEMFPIPGTETVQLMDMDGSDEIKKATPVEGPLCHGEFFSTEEDKHWVRYLFQSHGWPGPEFRREECFEVSLRSIER